MKLISFAVDGVQTYGAVTDEGIIDLGIRMRKYPLLQDILTKEALPKAQKIIDRGITDFEKEDIELLRPIPYPEKIVCIGVNYGNRNEEYKDGSDAPKFPSVFMRTPDSLVPHGEPIMRPPESEQLDYEGEIVIVIGKGGRRIGKENFADHIGGLSIMNEGTLRDWLRHAKFNVTQGKNFAASGSFGPWIVTADEIAGYDDITVKTRVNDETRQDDTTANIIFDFSYIISYLSTFMELKPGDVIATGTPTGAGARFDPPKWLVPGDEVEVEIYGVGTLRNTIEDELPA